MRNLLASIAMAALVSAAPAAAVTINFDNLNNGDQVTTQYAGVTFSSTSPSGATILTSGATFGSSQPNVLVGGFGFGDVILDFTDSVNNLIFKVVGDDDANSLTVQLFQGATSTTFNPAIDGNYGTTDTVNVSGYSGITRLILSNNDGGGIGFDDFSFDISDPAQVPEPAMLGLMGLGVLGLAFGRRKRA